VARQNISCQVDFFYLLVCTVPKQGKSEMRLAFVSQFVDRRHGTERSVAELLSRLTKIYGWEIYLYAQSVEGLEVVTTREAHRQNTGVIYWRRLPAVPGPYVFRFLFWYILNRWRRAWDRLFHGVNYDLVCSPGINWSDAGVILVHVVFHRLSELQNDSSRIGLRAWHRRAYYKTLCALEQRLYRDPRVALAAVSRHTAEQLAFYFGRKNVSVSPHGVDMQFFHPGALAPLRNSARERWKFAAHEVVLLLVGNDWSNKGLPTLLEAASLCHELPLRLLVVGEDNPAPFISSARQFNVLDRVIFASPSADVRSFYAAADILISPSLEDSFNLPCLEAMACGLPVILSPNAGISEWIRSGTDAVLLSDPKDSHELAGAIRALLSNPERMRRLGENAARTAATLTWDRHAKIIHELLCSRLTSSF